MQRERERERQEKRANRCIGGRRGGEGGGVVKMGPAAMCAADRLLMVFVSPRPVPVQGGGAILLSVT